MPKLRIAHVSPEAAPLAKTGGLGDVVSALALAHERSGHRVTVFLPYYREVRKRNDVPVEPVLNNLPVHIAPGVREEVTILRTQLQGSKVTVLLVDHPKSFDRDHLYGTPAGDYPDNADRFVLFSRAVLQTIKELNESYSAVHCHDWQTALIPAYFKRLYQGEPVFAKTVVVYSIHNLAYQGAFPKDTVPRIGLGWEIFTPDQLEFYGKVNFMKAGILYADRIATVSPTYAKEIVGTEAGCGLDGLLRTRKKVLTGILNGISQEEWDPAKDPHIAAQFSRKDVKGKEECRRALIEEMGLRDPERSRALLVGMVGRLADQKGFDLVAEAVPKITAKPVLLVMLGTGDAKLQELLEETARRHPDRVAFKAKFDSALAHRIYAGSDAFLMPSRFEPCGLGQLIALRYGTIPIVRATGGLIDTIKPIEGKKRGTGFVFKTATADDVSRAVLEAQAMLSGDEEGWAKLQQVAMGEDFSWTASAKKYEALYH